MGRIKIYICFVSLLPLAESLLGPQVHLSLYLLDQHSGIISMWV